MYLFKVQPAHLGDKLRRGRLNNAVVVASIADEAIETVRCLSGVDGVALTCEVVGTASSHLTPGVVCAGWNS